MGIAIGFETLGIDVQVQMQSWQDSALPWTTSPLKAHKPPTPYDNYTYYKPCTQNMTLENYKDQKRCAMPLLSQQWCPKFDADEVVGLEKAVKQQLGKQLAGIGKESCRSSTRPMASHALVTAVAAPVT